MTETIVVVCVFLMVTSSVLVIAMYFLGDSDKQSGLDTRPSTDTPRPKPEEKPTASAIARDAKPEKTKTEAAETEATQPETPQPKEAIIEASQPESADTEAVQPTEEKPASSEPTLQVKESSPYSVFQSDSFEKPSSFSISEDSLEDALKGINDTDEALEDVINASMPEQVANENVDSVLAIDFSEIDEDQVEPLLPEKRSLFENDQEDEGSTEHSQKTKPLYDNLEGEGDASDEYDDDEQIEALITDPDNPKAAEVNTADSSLNLAQELLREAEGIPTEDLELNPTSTSGATDSSSDADSGSETGLALDADISSMISDDEFQNPSFLKSQLASLAQPQDIHSQQRESTFYNPSSEEAASTIPEPRPIDEAQVLEDDHDADASDTKIRSSLTEELASNQDDESPISEDPDDLEEMQKIRSENLLQVEKDSSDDKPDSVRISELINKLESSTSASDNSIFMQEEPLPIAGDVDQFSEELTSQSTDIVRIDVQEVERAADLKKFDSESSMFSGSFDPATGELGVAEDRTPDPSVEDLGAGIGLDIESPGDIPIEIGDVGSESGELTSAQKLFSSDVDEAFDTHEGDMDEDEARAIQDVLNTAESLNESDLQQEIHEERPSWLEFDDPNYDESQDTVIEQADHDYTEEEGVSYLEESAKENLDSVNDLVKEIESISSSNLDEDLDHLISTPPLQVESEFGEVDDPDLEADDDSPTSLEMDEDVSEESELSEGHVLSNSFAVYDVTTTDDDSGHESENVLDDLETVETGSRILVDWEHGSQEDWKEMIDQTTHVIRFSDLSNIEEYLSGQDPDLPILGWDGSGIIMEEEWYPTEKEPEQDEPTGSTSTESAAGDQSQETSGDEHVLFLTLESENEASSEPSAFNPKQDLESIFNESPYHEEKSIHEAEESGHILNVGAGQAYNSSGNEYDDEPSQDEESSFSSIFETIPEDQTLAQQSVNASNDDRWASENASSSSISNSGSKIAILNTTEDSSANGEMIESSASSIHIFTSEEEAESSGDSATSDSGDDDSIFEDDGSPVLPSQTLIPTPIDTDTEFSITVPVTLVPNKSYILDFWVHTASMRATVLQRAHDAYHHDQVQIESTKGMIRDHAMVLKARLDLDAIDVDEPEDIVVWDDQIGNAHFLLHVPHRIKRGQHPGKISLYVSGLRIAQITFVLSVSDHELPPARIVSQVERHESGIACYAESDKELAMTRCLQLGKAVPYLEVYVQLESLRQSPQFEADFRRELENRDVYYLFWSPQAASSEQVEKEWRLALLQHGPDYINLIHLSSVDETSLPETLRLQH